jgi:hypothetical protein
MPDLRLAWMRGHGDLVKVGVEGTGPILSNKAGEGIGRPRCWVMNATTCPLDCRIGTYARRDWRADRVRALLAPGRADLPARRDRGGAPRQRGRSRAREARTAGRLMRPRRPCVTRLASSMLIPRPLRPSGEPGRRPGRTARLLGVGVTSSHHLAKPGDRRPVTHIHGSRSRCHANQATHDPRARPPPTSGSWSATGPGSSPDPWMHDHTAPLLNFVG